MPNRQYVACQFNPWDRRTYTYHNDGGPVASGDQVEVETKDGAKVVQVVTILDGPPSFETKPITGKVAQPADTSTEREI